MISTPVNVPIYLAGNHLVPPGRAATVGLRLAVPNLFAAYRRCRGGSCARPAGKPFMAHQAATGCAATHHQLKIASEIGNGGGMAGLRLVVAGLFAAYRRCRGGSCARPDGKSFMAHRAATGCAATYHQLKIASEIGNGGGMAGLRLVVAGLFAARAGTRPAPTLRINIEGGTAGLRLVVAHLFAARVGTRPAPTLRINIGGGNRLCRHPRQRAFAR